MTHSKPVYFLYNYVFDH